MKLYKYRDFSKPDDAEFLRLEGMLHRRTFWCARPDTLNDPVEFAWTCDFATTADTMGLLTEVLIRVSGPSRADASNRAFSSIQAGRLKALAEPVIAEMIQQCRDQVGVACFGTSPDNSTLWRRYAGQGAGVCVELDLPDKLLGVQLFEVQYSDNKVIHIDQLLRGFLDPGCVAEVYSLALLSKPSSWKDEVEVRFISRLQKVSVVVEESRITQLILGDALDSSVSTRLKRIASAIPVARGGVSLI